VGMGIGLYARVLNGQCDENANYWDVGRCNYMTGLTVAPTDYVLYMTLLPIYLQQILRGLSFRMAVITCSISALSVTISILQATKTIDLGTLGCSVRVLLMLYTYEKLSRVIFVKNRTLAAANLANKAHLIFKQQSEQLRITEKNKYELEIRAFKAEEESRLLESERKQMVALLGNVAHDLKTPLQAFLMDLEALKTAVETSRSKSKTA
jgi:signal transduction histidine kinase